MQPQEQILTFENANGITLPAQYKGMVVIFDGGEFFRRSRRQFLTVPHDKPVIDASDDNDRPSEDGIGIALVRVTYSCKKEGERRLPSSIMRLKTARR